MLFFKSGDKIAYANIRKVVRAKIAKANIRERSNPNSMSMTLSLFGMA